MRIINLKAQNIKKIKAIEITPDKNLVEITGKNGQGKTSILDSILYALAGKKFIPETALRKGQEKGKIEIDLGELLIERVFTKTDTYLRVKTKDGAEFKKSQGKLDNLFSGVSFDPVEFINQKERDQVIELLDLMGINEQYVKLSTKFNAAYEERKYKSRDAKEAGTRVEVLPEKIESMSVFDLMKGKELLEADKRNIQEFNDEIGHQKQIIKQRQRTCERLKAEFDKAKYDLEFEKRAIEILIDDVPKPKEWKGEDKIRAVDESIAGVEEVNAKAAEYKRVKALITYHDQTVKEEKDASDAVDLIVKEKEVLFSEGKLPIAGLTVKKGHVVYNGIPLAECSESEKIIISLRIAMRKNPKLKIMRIKNASVCDKETIEIIKKEIIESDYQLWYETIDQDNENSIVIEAGEIKKLEVV